MAKKFYKKIDIIFWFFMMFLPILIGLITMIGWSCNYKLFENQTFNNGMMDSFGRGILAFGDFIPTFIILTFGNLFNTLGITSIASNIIIVYASWLVWVVYVHLLVDIMAFIPKFFHKWLRKADKYDE